MTYQDNHNPSTDDDRSLASLVVKSLGARIITGQLAPGTALRQDHIAVEFKTSHVPVREAFRRLEAQGLVTSEPRRGVRVSPLDVNSIVEITEMRAALEVIALRFAIPRITEPDLVAARQAIADDAETPAGEFLILEAANRRFHDAITRRCAMPTLLATLEQLRFGSARIMVAMWKGLPAWQGHSGSEHQAILDAIQQRDSEIACSRLRAHIVDGAALLTAGLAGATARPRS
jgi:DNA-binding GntR family transcriptional regulator